MAEVNTDLYKGLGPKPIEAINPMQAISMLGGLNQAALFSQVYGARQGVGEAYKDFANHGDPSKLQKDIATRGGFEAGPAVGQAITNSTNQFAQQKGQLDWLRSNTGALASKKDVSLKDIDNFIVTAARNTNIPVAMLQSIADGARTTKGDPAALRKYLSDQAKTALGLGALEKAEGPPDESGTPQAITRGEQQDRLLGVIPREGAAGQTGMPTDVAPGFTQAAEASAGEMAKARQRSSNYAFEMFPMTEALASTRRLGTQGTGPGTQEINAFKSFLISNIPDSVPGADKLKKEIETVKEYDKLEKYATQIVGPLSAQFGHGTDQAVVTAAKASPSARISNLAANELWVVVIGLRAMDQMRIRDAEAQGVGEGKYTKWAGDWAQKVDPRALMLPWMDDKQKQYLKESLKTPEQKRKFATTVQRAKELGVIEGGQ